MLACIKRTPGLASRSGKKSLHWNIIRTQILSGNRVTICPCFSFRKRPLLVRVTITSREYRYGCIKLFISSRTISARSYFFMKYQINKQLSQSVNTFFIPFGCFNKHLVIMATSNDTSYYVCLTIYGRLLYRINWLIIVWVRILTDIIPVSIGFMNESLAVIHLEKKKQNKKNGVITAFIYRMTLVFSP